MQRSLCNYRGGMSNEPEHAPQAARRTRRIDARSLRGLAHPLRMKIFELLSLDGPATSTGRWWKRVGVTNELNTADFRDDPDTRGALSVYLHELVHQYFNRVVNYLGEEWDDRWRSAGTVSDWRDLRMTPNQLAALNAELMDVIARHTPAPDAEPAPDALPVVVQLQSFPRKERGTA